MTNINFEIERLEGRGITAKVINSGAVYTTYRTFAEAAGYPDAVSASYDKKSENAELLEGKTVRVLAKGLHEYRHRTLYVVQDALTGENFIFGENGLEIIEKGDGPMTKSYEDLIADITQIMAQVHEMGYEQGKTEERMALAKKLADDVLKETPQQARDRIVEQAKSDVEELLNDYQLSEDETEFIVNRQKRAVVVLLKGYYSRDVFAKGIAKCAPDDCFNVHIGKAIALRRALGLEVPAEYLNTPQPTEVRVGDIILPSVVQDNVPRTVVTTDEEVDAMENTCAVSSVMATKNPKVIDDSREGVTQ